ncbi:FtsZ-interacting cell division protein YlmF [Streptomyces aurantiacus]|uniref:DNA primase n=1 Tax=Streptomyces aurantiacus TaxID=47760 RepID=UPI00278D4EB9|nr:DNA primase [Streptomyces aurantiacus]MDQ0773375.1 FtsZ-interacting cell division protein YlmF [Streptomyces aurantiacus]
MNRLGLGLAVGAGYVLGRTKKMKLAFAVGTMVAGKRMHLSPRALGELATQQLQNNPQFKEIGDQLRQDLRGVGKAASGALVERQITGLADRLHGRTAQVKDQLAGVVPDDEYEDEYEEDDGRADEDDERGEGEAEAGGGAGEERPRERERAPAKKAPAKKAAEKRSPATKAPAKKAPAKKASAKKTAAKKTAAPAAKKAPAKKTAAAKTAGRRVPQARTTRGGGDDD